MLDQLAKNITRCGLSNSTLNYLRVSKTTFILEFNLFFFIFTLCSILLMRFVCFFSPPQSYV